MCSRFLAFLFLILTLTSAKAADAPYGLNVSESELRFVFGIHSLAVDLELGRHGPADYVRAAEAYRKAAVLGLSLAQNDLGRLYETGRGVPRDPVVAHMWYLIAARNGDEVLRQNRDQSARHLSSDELAQAEALANGLQRHLPDARQLNGR